MKMLNAGLVIFILCLMIYAQTYKPPKNSESLLKGINFQKAMELDPQYKTGFDDCDINGGKCNTDKNNLKALLRFGDNAVFFDSKMALDVDGSFVGCNCGNNMGMVDQCSTSYFWKNFPNDYDSVPKKDRCKFYKDQDFVDSNKIPFIVIPGGFARHLIIDNKETDLIGNIGVVIYKNKIVPVLVADGGPTYRIGEGSAALFRAVGVEKCKKFVGEQCVEYESSGIGASVLFLIFPNSKIGKDKLNKDNALELIKSEAMKKFEEFKKSL